MNTNRVTVRYAKALYEFAFENKKTKQVYDDMHLLSGTVKIPEFRNMLENPTIFPSKKNTAFKEIMKNKIDPVTERFFELLTENKRESYLGAIARNYIGIYLKENNIKSAEIITAFVPGKSLTDKIVNVLSQHFKSNIEMKTKTDESIIGGFVLTVEGMRYDASIAGKLKNVKKEMLNE